MTWSRVVMGVILLLVIVALLGVYSGGLDTFGTTLPSLPTAP